MACVWVGLKPGVALTDCETRAAGAACRGGGSGAARRGGRCAGKRLPFGQCSYDLAASNQERRGI
jgi:hypothetical protein